MKSEFCEENIEFWLACEDFKKTKSPQKLTSKAKKIYNDFIEKEAPKEVKKTCLNINALLYELLQMSNCIVTYLTVNVWV